MENMNLNWIIKLILILPFTVVYCPTKYVYDSPSISFVELPIGSSVGYLIDKKNYKFSNATPKICWYGYPPVYEICCFTENKTSNCGYEECCRYDNSRNMFERKPQELEFTLYFTKIPNYDYDPAFYMIGGNVMDSDQRASIKTLMNNIFGRHNALSLVPYTHHFFCPVEETKVKCLMRSNDTEIPLTVGNNSIDDKYQHRYMEIAPRDPPHVTQIECRCNDENADVVVNIMWTNTSIDLLYYDIPELLKISERVLYEEQHGIHILLDTKKRGRNITCYTTHETNRIHWSKGWKTNHIAIQERTKTWKFNCPNCAFFHIEGTSTKPAQYILEYKAKDGEIAEIFCSTVYFNFAAVTYILGGEKLTKAQQDVYSILSFNNMSIIRIRYTDSLHLRIMIPARHKVKVYTKHEKNADYWREDTSNIAVGVFNETVDVGYYHRIYTNRPYEQIRFDIADYPVGLNFYLHWTLQSDGEDPFPSDPLMAPQSKLSGRLIELRTSILDGKSSDGSFDGMPSDVLTSIYLMASCIFVLAVLFIASYMFLLFHGFTRYIEETDSQNEANTINCFSRKKPKDILEGEEKDEDEEEVDDKEAVEDAYEGEEEPSEVENKSCLPCLRKKKKDNIEDEYEDYNDDGEYESRYSDGYDDKYDKKYDQVMPINDDKDEIKQKKQKKKKKKKNKGEEELEKDREEDYDQDN